MSKGSLLLCSLVLLQVCIVQLCLISSCWQLTAGQTAGGKVLCQDPIGRPARLMSNHGRGREELDGHSSDWIFDEEQEPADEGLVAVHECGSDGGGGAPAEEEEEEEEGWLPEDDGGGGAKQGGSSSGSGGGDVECPECGKFFKNDKSMFGHLRSHPNRGYKGATPPVNKLKLSPEPETPAVASSSSPSPSRGTHQPRARRDRPLTLFEQVCTFAMLTLPYPDNNQPTQQVPPAPAPPKSETNVEHGCETNVEHGVGNSNMRAAEAHADQHGGSIVKIPKKRRNLLKGIRDREAHRKKAKLVPSPPPVPKEKVPYICKHCYAEFPTHQALGGHMAGHHRDKKVQTLNDASSSKAQQVMAAQSQDGGKLQVKGGVDDDDDGWHDSGVSLRRSQLSESEQPSMASNVTRQSGQASGGQTTEMRQQHSGRRSHGLTRASPAPALTPTQADDRGGGRLLNIDLNAEAEQE